ncbi:MAG: hypothetical protein ACRDZ7_15320 [Acidimicrobiia bacterium]
MTWRLVRQVLLLMTVAAVGVLAIAPAVASSDDSGKVAGTGRPAVHRLTLVPGPAHGQDSTFTATVEASVDGGATWAPAAGEQVTFAYVTDGAGYVTAINDGPIGSMSCVTDGAGQCRISVHTDVPGDAVVTAVAGSLSASAVVG